MWARHTIIAATLASPLLLTGCGTYGLTEYSDEGLRGTDLIIFPEADVQFPPTPTGSSSWEDIFILSTGDQSVQVEEIWMEGDGADDFELGGELAVPRILEPGQEWPLTIHFAPLDVGKSRAVLVVGTGRLGQVEIRRKVSGQACADDDYDGVCDSW